MAGIRRLILRYGLIGAVIAVFLAGSASSIKTLFELYEHEEKILRTGSWLAVQAQVEFLRFQRAVDHYAHGDVSADELRLRFELLWSRLPLLWESAESVVIKDIPAVRQTAADLFAAVERLDPTVRSLVDADAGAAAVLKEALAPFDTPVYQMVQAAMLAMDYDHEVGQALQSRILLLLGGTLLMGAVLIVLLVSEARTASRERRKAEIAEGRLKNALDSISEGFVLHDARERLVLCNERYKDLYGLTDADVAAGIRFEDMLRDRAVQGRYGLSAAAAADWIGERLARFRSPSSVHEQHLADGRWIEVRERKLPDGGTVGVRIDITLLKAREEELRRALNKVEEASRAKSNFLANMSHELRTPLNAIIGFAEILECGYFGPLGHPNYTGYAADIRQSGRHLLGVISDILDMARIEAGQLSLAEEATEIGALADAALRMVWHRAAEKRLALENDLGGTLPALVVDAQKIRQVLINLLSNAVKFTPPGGRIRIEGHLGPEEVEIRVRDTGIGMEESQIPVALTPFRQLDSAMSRKFEGTGLGLPISQALVALHGGDLRIGSRPGAGTCVRVILPASRIAAVAVESGAEMMVPGSER